MSLLGDAMGVCKVSEMSPKDRQRKAQHRARILAKRRSFGYKGEHHLIQEKVLTENLVALQRQLALPQNKDISDAAIRGKDFAECLGIIAAKLDILLDGNYTAEDIDSICGVLANSMSRRYEHVNQPHLRDTRLVNVELVEREGTITVEEVDSSVGTVAPNTGRFVVCDTCKQSFDCITERQCLAQKPKAVTGVVLQ